MWSTLKKSYCIVLYCIALSCVQFVWSHLWRYAAKHSFLSKFLQTRLCLIVLERKATEESARRPTKSLRKPKLTLSNTKLTVSSGALYSAVFVFQNNSAVGKLNDRQDRQDYSAVGEQIYKAIKVLGNCLLPIIETSLPCFLWQSCNLSRNVKQVARDSLYNKGLLPPENIYFFLI